MRLFLSMLFVATYLFAFDVGVRNSIKTSSPVLDMCHKKSQLWCAAANGEVFLLDSNGKKTKKFTIPKRTDLVIDKADQKALAVAISDDANLVAVGSEDGSIFIFDGSKVTKTKFSTRTVIKKIEFLSETKLLVALISSELIVFDLSSQQITASTSVSTSTLSDMALSNDKSTAYVVGEAGVVYLIDTKTMKIKWKFQGGNVDNIYKLDIQSSHVLTAGQDRRSILYTPSGKIQKRFDGTFLIYAVALSPDLLYAVGAMDEQNNLTIHNIQNGSSKTVKGHGATLNKIIFLDKSTFVSSADENKIIIWRIK